MSVISFDFDEALYLELFYGIINEFNFHFSQFDPGSPGDIRAVFGFFKKCSTLKIHILLMA